MKNVLNERKINKMAKVTKDTLIGEALMIDMGIAELLMESGMHCVGCPASQAESIEEACAVHGIETQPLVDKINEYLANK
mgnify:CR=1 FL=1